MQPPFSSYYASGRACWSESRLTWRIGRALATPSPRSGGALEPRRLHARCYAACHRTPPKLPVSDTGTVPLRGTVSKGASLTEVDDAAPCSKLSGFAMSSTFEWHSASVGLARLRSNNSHKQAGYCDCNDSNPSRAAYRLCLPGESVYAGLGGAWKHVVFDPKCWRMDQY